MQTRLLIPVLTVLLAACAGGESTGPAAVAQLEPTKGNNASGTVRFVQAGNRVLVTGEFKGLTPNAEHGFHVHEKGDCSSGDGMSAGGHFNPLLKPHGMHTSTERHVGDMPNLRADAKGTATIRAELDVMTVGEGPTGIIGKGLIVHRDPDDYKSQPVGNAGPRIACAVIRRS